MLRYIFSKLAKNSKEHIKQTVIASIKALISTMKINGKYYQRNLSFDGRCIEMKLQAKYSVEFAIWKDKEIYKIV